MAVTQAEMDAIKTQFLNEIATMKTAIMADIEGRFGKPDEEYRKTVEKQIGELEDQVKELMKPKSNDAAGAFGENGDPWCGYKGGAEFLDSVIKDALRVGDKDIRLAGIMAYETEKAALDGVEIDTSEYGGYLAPEAFRTQVWERAVEVSDLISRIMILPIGAQSLKIPAFGGYDQSGGTTFGGITFYKEGENETMQAVRPKFELMEWSMGLHAALLPISDPMMKFSAITIEPMVRQMLGRALGWYIDSKLIGGTGAAEPRGFINSACIITQDAEPGQAADTIERENLSKMYSRVFMKNDMIWGFNPECGPELDSLAFVVGAGGSIVTMEQAFKGKPFIESDHFSAIGDAGDIMALMPGEMLMTVPTGQASEAQIDSSLHFQFDTGQNVLRIMHYMDAKVGWRTFHTPVNGTATRGPVVKLEAR